MKKELLMGFLFSFIMLSMVSLSFAAKIHLKNGTVIEGEIISFDKTHVTIEDPIFGIRKISRDKIIKTEPPLAEKSPEKPAEKPAEKPPEKPKKVKKQKPEETKKPEEVTEEIIVPEIPVPKPEPIKKEIPEKTPLPPPKKPVQEPSQVPRLLKFISEMREKKRISIYLSGGMNSIKVGSKGGDINTVIRDYNELIVDYNDYYLTNHSANWKELEWLQNFKGEVLLNLSANFSVGLGVEYLTTWVKKGTVALAEDDEGTFYETFTYYNYTEDYDYSFEPQQTLTAIPLSFNVYFFLPIGKFAQVFATGGVDYYFGKFKYSEPYQSVYEYQAEYYNNSDTYLYTYFDNYTEDGTYTYEATCNKTGFHGGLGFDIKLFSFISLVVDANYRYIKFNDWNGNGNDNWNWSEDWGRTDIGSNSDSGSESDSWNGKVWYYEIYDSGVDKQYGFISLEEEEPETSEYIKNIRHAAININGFSLRAGIRVSF